MNGAHERCNLFLTSGGVAFGATLLIGLFNQVPFTTSCVVEGYLFLAFSGVVFAVLLQRWADAVLPGNGRPWYARPWSPALFWVAILAFNTVWTELDTNIISGSEFARAVPWWSRQFVLNGMALITVPCLDYPQGERPPRPTGGPSHRSRRSPRGMPVFRRYARTPARSNAGSTISKVRS